MKKELYLKRYEFSKFIWIFMDLFKVKKFKNINFKVWADGTIDMACMLACHHVVMCDVWCVRGVMWRTRDACMA